MGTKLFFITIIKVYLLIYTFQIYGQSSPNKFLVGIIAEDIEHVDQVFDGYFIRFRDKPPLSGYIHLIDIDTFDMRFKNSNVNSRLNSAELIKIRVKIDKSLPIGIMNDNISKLKNDTLEYYLMYSFYRYYKLFGFYNSDIGYFSEYIGSYRVASFLKELVRHNILTSKERRILSKTLRNKERSYPTSLNKPCEFLKYFTEERNKSQSNSTILPVLKIHYPRPRL